MIDKLREIINQINEKESMWYQLAPEFERILGSKQVADLIDEFEGAFAIIPQKHLPHYSFVFYLALVTIADEEEEIAKIVQDKKSYRLMKVGFRIFLSGDSPKLKYEGQLLHDRYKNKYEYVDFYSGFSPEYSMKLRGYTQLLKLIHEVNKEDFWDLLSQDKQNVIVLCIFVEGRISFDYDELSFFLSAEDKLKANGAFFYLMRSFSYLVMKHEHEQTDETEREVQKEAEKIHEVFCELLMGRRVHFIINYLFEEDRCPTFFVEELKQSDINIVLDELENQDLTNLYKLVNIYKIMSIVNKTEIEFLFVEKLLGWVKNESNINIWQSLKHKIKGIFQLMDSDSCEKLTSELIEYKDTLFVTSFDREVRYGQYLNEEQKLQVIEDILTW